MSQESTKININTLFNKQSLNVLEPYLKPTFTHIEGDITGKIKIHGPLKNPNWTGSIYANKASMFVTPTNVNYHFDDSIF